MDEDDVVQPWDLADVVERVRIGTLSPTVRRVQWPLLIAAPLVMVASFVAGLVVAGAIDDDPAQPQDVSGSTVPRYDVDGDGTPDYAVVQGEVVAAPNRASNRSVGIWLPVVGTVAAAALAAVASVGVALLNKDGGRKVEALTQRLDRLEGRPPG